LIASIDASVVFWYTAEGLGLILTGMSTDFNSGLLVVVMALACWPRVKSLRMSARERLARKLQEVEESGTTQRV